MSQETNQPPDSPLTQLRQFITDHYDLEELRTLAFDLAIPYDALPSQGTAAKARELLLYLGRRGRLDELLTELKRGRPKAFDEAGLKVAPDVLRTSYGALSEWEAIEANDQLTGMLARQLDILRRKYLKWFAAGAIATIIIWFCKAPPLRV